MVSEPTRTEEFVVEGELLTDVGGTLPYKVLSTPGMIHTMEWACTRLIREVGPRDGFQNEPEVVPTDAKVRLIELLAASGLKRLEVTSFVRADGGLRRGDARVRREAPAGVQRALSRRRSCVPTPIVRSPSSTSTSKRNLRSSTTSRSAARTTRRVPSRAPPTCLTHTS